jgi:hypothetical protein
LETSTSVAPGHGFDDFRVDNVESSSTAPRPTSQILGRTLMPGNYGANEYVARAPDESLNQKGLEPSNAMTCPKYFGVTSCLQRRQISAAHKIV